MTLLRWFATIGMLMSMVMFAAAVESTADRDGDGIADAAEETLGTDPASPDVFRVIQEKAPRSPDKAKGKNYDAGKEVTRVEFCHVGSDRCLWRVTFVGPTRADNMVLHLYVDADGNEATGRKGAEGSPSTGTEYMLSAVGGQGHSTHYSPDGKTIAGPEVRFVVLGNTLLLSADVDLRRDAQGIGFGLYVLCHTQTAAAAAGAPKMSDSTAKKLVSGLQVSERKKIFRLQDHLENFQVEATFGEGLLHATLAGKGNLCVGHDQLQLDGFAVDLFTSDRWPHVRMQKSGGKVWTEAPRAGRYHVGFMMFDGASDERIGIFVAGQCRGVAVARQDNRRTWMYWLEKPIEFRGGERVELRPLVSTGGAPICNILFLAKPPEVRKIRYAVEHMTSAAPVGFPGRAILSWVTTWPCPTRVEYGRDSHYGKTAGSDDPTLVHRVVLDGLDSQAAHHARAVGADRDGKPFYGADYTFRALPPTPPASCEKPVEVPLTVRNPHPLAAKDWPITTGVPVPEGFLASPDHVRLLGPAGEESVQVKLTGRWRDGSVKWLLVTFMASAPAKGESVYRLEMGRHVRRSAVPAPIAVAKNAQGVTVDGGSLRFSVNAQGNLCDIQRDGHAVLPSGKACVTLVTDGDQTSASTAHAAAQVEIEESGPLRVVVKIMQDLKRPALRVETRIEAYRQSPALRVHHALLVVGDKDFVDLNEVRYRMPLACEKRSWSVPLASGKSLTLNSEADTVRQLFDAEYCSAAASAMGRVVGAAIAVGKGGCAVAVRDFWQNYPKGLTVADDAVNLALCPAFEAGTYDKFPFEKEGHHLYYYLQGGKYRLKRGMAKTHELLLCFAPEGEREQCCVLFQEPLLAAPPAEWSCRSKAFYDVAPRDPQKFKLYEEAMAKNLAAYAVGRERTHDYGLMNYGDWYPERGANWGNIEYDTQHAFFLEYIRSGNPAAFALGCAAELHNRDIDTVQWDADVKKIGAVYVHQMGHVGGYYDKSVPGTLGIPKASFSVTHAWAEGHFDHYFLTGDRRSYETACAVSDYFTRAEFRAPYDFLSCREPGWHLIMLAAAYAATSDPYYLNAARVVIERVLETQDCIARPLPGYQAAGRQPNQIGGWSRMLVPGHCLCEPRHRGNAGFMVAVLLAGMKYYYDVTGDPAVKESIIRGAHYLVDECYSDEVRGFRYTSCPKTRYVPGASPLMVEGIARAYLWTKDERFRRVLTEALPLGSSGAGYGKGFSMYYRMAPRVLADLDAAGIGLNAAPEGAKK